MSGPSRKRKIIACALGACVLLIGGGIGYAFWSSTGATGTGTALTSNQQNSLTIVQVNTPAGLAPGVASVPVTARIDNAASGTSTFITQVVVTVSDVSPSGCPEGNYGLTVGSSTPVLTSNAASVSGSPPTITLAINKSLSPGGTVNLPAFTIGFVDYVNVNQDVCQGAVPTLHYAAS